MFSTFSRIGMGDMIYLSLGILSSREAPHTNSEYTLDRLRRFIHHMVATRPPTLSIKWRLLDHVRCEE